MPTVPPQSAQKTRARRVFGEFIVEDDMDSLACSSSARSSNNNSLCYSSAPSAVASVKSLIDEENHPPPTSISVPTPKPAPIVVASVGVSNAQENRLQPQQSAPPADQRSKRRNLVSETQLAITNATLSVNASLNAARRARKNNFDKKAQQTSKVRNQWKEEKEEATQFHNESERVRQGLLNLQRQLSSNAIREKARRKQEARDTKLTTIAQETEFNSQTYRQHQQTLKDERDRKRRESTDARAKLRKNHRTGEEKLRMMRIQEDQALFHERNEGYNASHKFKSDIAESRRKSFCFRTGDAKRIRDTFNRLQEDALHQEQASLQLKLAGARDADAHRKAMAEERRVSFEFRHKYAAKQRVEVKGMQYRDQMQEHESYELKWDGEKDAEAYRREMEEQRRQSLQLRNKTSVRQDKFLSEQRHETLVQEQASIQLKLAGERDADEYRRQMAEERRKSMEGRHKLGKKQRDRQGEMDQQEFMAEHESYELKWDGQRDADAYQRRMEQERRESLNFRNKEGVRHAKVMEELQALAREKEAESFMLKWAGENDAKDYLAQLEQDRRTSLQLRNKEGRRHRRIEDEQHDEQVQQMHHDELLRAAGHKDMQEYKKKCDERDRASLEFRRKEANIQRLEEQRDRQEEYEHNQINIELDDGAHSDVLEYIEDCKARRRMSLVVRAKEKRRHRKWEQKQANVALEQQMEDTRWRGKDRRAGEMARREERRRIAMDAIRHAGCSFNVNA